MYISHQSTFEPFIVFVHFLSFDPSLRWPRYASFTGGHPLQIILSILAYGKSVPQNTKMGKLRWQQNSNTHVYMHVRSYGQIIGIQTQGLVDSLTLPVREKKGFKKMNPFTTSNRHQKSRIPIYCQNS